MNARLSRLLRPLPALAAACVMTGGAAFAAEGRIVIETVKERPVITYLPPSYDTDGERRYPVIYLLHGGGGAPRSFIEGNYSGMNIRTTMNNLITVNVIREMIVVMPDISTPYRDFIMEDVIPYVDATYRTLASREHRGIAGHSRGGCASFILATDHPDMFAAVYGLAASCLDREDPLVEGAPERGTRPSLIARLPALKASIKDLAIAFDVGTRDRLIVANQSMADAMVAAGVAHVFETYEGDHNGGVRQRIASRLLPFFSRQLAAQ
jgi:enterochelin esterase-like enzyme